MMGRIFVVIPVKHHARAKLRMSSLLSGQERARLAAAMFEDVIRALKPLSRDIGCAVLTNDASAAARTRELGWRLLPETEQITESASVDRACRALESDGVEAVLRLPADIPLVRVGDIEGILSSPSPAGTAILVPSADGTGTNAVLRSPPTLFPSRFGLNSLVLHQQEGARVQAALRLVANGRIALDLDEPLDVLKFMEVPSSTETRDLLEQSGITERLMPHAV